MMLHYYYFLFATAIVTSSQEVEVVFKTERVVTTHIKMNDADLLPQKENFPAKTNKPKLQVYYESLCSGCIKLQSTQLRKVVELLHQYVEIHTYPFGKAVITNDTDGNVAVICAFGPPDCYGNKLHGCALNIIANQTEALLLVSCISEHRSTDDAADLCGKQMNINVDSIKECAMGKMGEDILIHYGEESIKVGFQYVPYVLLNGKEWKWTPHLFSDICTTFDNPPEPCNQDYYVSSS